MSADPNMLLDYFTSSCVLKNTSSIYERMKFLLFNQSNDLKFDHSYIKKILIHQSWHLYIVYDIVLLDSNSCWCTFDHMVSFLTLRFNDSISFSFLLTEKCAIDSEGAFFREFLLLSLLLWKEGAPPMGLVRLNYFSAESAYFNSRTRHLPLRTDGALFQSRPGRRTHK